MAAKTRVYLTVDVECAEERLVRGALQPALGYDLRVWGRFANHHDELGVPLIMRELERFGHRATFYVDPFGARGFGLDGLRDVCSAILARGHDVQLHAHPIQTEPRYRSRGVAPLDDDMHARDVAGQAALLREGIDMLVAAGVQREAIRSFRAGNFGADNRTWRAMAEVGLNLSSNLNANYLSRNCKIESAHTTGLFDTGVGVWELPISNFLEGTRPRHLQIMAVSLGEMVDYLEQARARGIGEVNVLTHSFEFFTVEDVAMRRARLSRVNLARLRGLCRFLRERDDAFEVETMGALAARLRATALESPRAPIAMPQGKRRHRYRRLAEQLFKRLASGFKLQSRYSS